MSTGEEHHEAGVGAASPFAILYSPRRAAEAAAASSVLWPLLLLAAAAGFSDYPMLARLGAAGLADARLAQTPSGLSSITIGLFLVSQFAAPLLLPLAVWLVGLFLAFYAIILLDARLKRRQVIRATAWAFLPVVCERVISGAFRLMHLNPDANPFNPVASNLGFFLDPTAVSPFWYGVASGVDVFSLWAIALAALALGALSRKSAASVLPPLLIAWAAGVLVYSAILG